MATGKKGQAVIWLTSDWHLFHKKIIQYSNRPFVSLDEMHHELIKRHNEKVKSDDLVIHVGDFSFGKREETLNKMAVNGSYSVITIRNAIT